MSLSLDTIKEDLEKELKADTLDFGRILVLANQIALYDEENLRFSIDAGLVNRLGRELVAKKETAVAELIKNAYDADSLSVDVSFSSEKSGEILIKDYGNGMTEEQLKHGYMRIATDDKVDEPVSPKYQRNRAGKKGIGRFAAQRLGRFLSIKTQPEQANEALKLDIDWEKFESGKDLFQIENHILKVPKESGSGTILTITGLRDEWNLNEISNVYSEILQLIQPFALERKPQNKKTTSKAPLEALKSVGKDFQVQIISHKKDVESLYIDLQSQVYSFALAEIDAYVDDTGSGYVSFKSDRLKSAEQNIQLTSDGIPLRFEKLRDVALKAYYFIYKKHLINKIREKDILELAKNKAGIRVYRNGFRVSPYGEQGDDWLKLDASTRGRKYLPPHANINFFGFVDLPSGEAFEETASREKLIDTVELKELESFAYESLITVVNRIAAIRGKKETASQKDWNNFNDAQKQLREVIARLNSTLGEAKAYMETQGAAKPAILEKLIEAADDARTQVERFNRTYKSFERKAIEEQAMLRILASLGLIIGEFTHEITQTLDAVTLGSSQLIDSLTPKTEAHDIAVELAENIKRFNTYASYFGETVAANADRDLAPQNLEMEVDRFIATIRPVANNSGIEITKTINVSDEELVSVSMHPSEWASILYNLYSNSHKSIIRAGNPGKIDISLNSDDTIIYLSFSDNGDGIPDSNKDSIFDPFFTTTRKARSTFEDNVYPQGAGLGLKIVKDIIVSYGGEIYLDASPEEFVTTFMLEIPKEKGT